MEFNYILTFSLSLILMFFIVPFMRQIAKRFKLVDQPDNIRKKHGKAIPLVGGISIMIVLLLVFFLQIFLFDQFSKNYISLLFGSLILLVTGVIDDKIEIHPYYKLIVQFICAYTIVASGFIGISFYNALGLGFLPVSIQYALLVLFVVGAINAYNLMDGIDGLVGNLFLINFTITAMISFIFDINSILIVSLGVLGAILGFLKYNFSKKKKIFLGDGGTLFLGFITVVININLIEQSLIANTNSLTIFLGLTAVMILPIYDALRVFYRRIRKGNSPFFPDRTHIHHVFLDIVPSVKKVNVMIITIVLMILGVATLCSSIFQFVLITSILLFLLQLFINMNLAIEEDKQIIQMIEQKFLY